MPNNRDARARELAKRRAEKQAAMTAPGSVSKYAKKKAEQRNGHYRKTSPFYQQA